MIFLGFLFWTISSCTVIISPISKISWRVPHGFHQSEDFSMWSYLPVGLGSCDCMIRMIPLKNIPQFSMSKTTTQNTINTRIQPTKLEIAKYRWIKMEVGNRLHQIKGMFSFSSLLLQCRLAMLAVDLSCRYIFDHLWILWWIPTTLQFSRVALSEVWGWLSTVTVPSKISQDDPRYI